MERYKKYHEEAVWTLLSSVRDEVQKSGNFTPWKIQEIEVQNRGAVQELFIHLRGPESKTGYFSIGLSLNVGGYTEMFNTVEISMEAKTQVRYRGHDIPLFVWGYPLQTFYHHVLPIERIGNMVVETFKQAAAFIEHNHPNLEYQGEGLKEVPENLKDVIYPETLYVPIDYDFEAITRELLLESIDGVYAYLDKTPLKNTEVRINQTTLMIKGILTLPDDTDLEIQVQLDVSTRGRATHAVALTCQSQTCDKCLQKHQDYKVRVNYVQGYSGSLDSAGVVERVHNLIEHILEKPLSETEDI